MNTFILQSAGDGEALGTAEPQFRSSSRFQDDQVKERNPMDLFISQDDQYNTETAPTFVEPMPVRA